MTCVSGSDTSSSLFASLLAWLRTIPSSRNRLRRRFVRSLSFSFCLFFFRIYAFTFTTSSKPASESIRREEEKKKKKGKKTTISLYALTRLGILRRKKYRRKKRMKSRVEKITSIVIATGNLPAR